MKGRTWFMVSCIIWNFTISKKFHSKMSETNPQEFILWSKLSSEFQNGKRKSNALEVFCRKLNPLLEKLNLEVDLVNTEYSIQ
jgi:hypothetical protein